MCLVLGKYSFPDPRQEALKLLSRMNEVTMTFGPDSSATYNPTMIYLAMDLSGSQADALQSAVNFLRPVVSEVREIDAVSCKLVVTAVVVVAVVVVVVVVIVVVMVLVVAEVVVIVVVVAVV